MAETATEGQFTDERPAPAPPPPGFAPATSPFGMTKEQLASRLYDPQSGMIEKQARAAEAKAEAMKPALEAARETARQPTPPVPTPPTLTPPPSRGLHAFLAPIDGESPVQTLTKLVQMTGLLAMGMGRGGVGSARASLAALGGAMEGWREGDKERADRAFADWKASTDEQLAQWETQTKAYKLILEAKDKDLASRQAELALLGMEHDNFGLPDKIRAEGYGAGLKWITDTEQQARQFEVLKRQLELSFLESQRRDMQFKAQIAETMRFHNAQIWKWAQEEKRLQDAVEAYTPEDFKMLGQQWGLEGKLPPNIARSKSGQMLMPKIMQGWREYAQEHNLDPNASTFYRAGVKSSTQALGQAEKGKTVAQVAVGTFERHMDQLVRLSADVPRSEMPAVNEAIVKGQQNFGGSVAAAKYVAMAYEAAQEFAKVSVGTAQGDEDSRRKAREAISVSLNHDQLVGVRDELKIAAKSRLAEWDSRINGLRSAIGTPGGQPGQPEPKKIRVKRKSDGVPGTMNEADFDPSKYERVGG